MHCATMFAVLGLAESNMLATLDDDQKKEVRRLMISAILATDMAHHQAMVKELTNQSAEQSTPIAVSFTLLQCLDVGKHLVEGTQSLLRVAQGLLLGDGCGGFHLHVALLCIGKFWRLISWEPADILLERPLRLVRLRPFRALLRAVP